jgi:hypothetical protein
MMESVVVENRIQGRILAKIGKVWYFTMLLFNNILVIYD